MSLAAEIRARAQRAGAGPRKRWGQNFLVEARILDAIAESAASPTAPVLEIGPGPGTLTERLAERAASVVAIERDPRWARFLALHFETEPRVRIVPGDAIRVDWAELVAQAGGSSAPRLAGNIPYNLSGPLLVAAWRSRQVFEAATFMLQAEVAQRLLAEPGTKSYGSLTVLFRRVGTVRRVARVAPGCFWPAPKVESAVVRISFDQPDLDRAAAARLEKVVRVAFGQRRKTLRNALASAHGRDAVRALEPVLDLDRRAETLEPAEFEALAARLEEEIASSGDAGQRAR